MLSLAVLGVAQADPSAVRAPGSPDFAVEVGTPAVSAAYWRGAHGVGAWARLDGGAAGAVVALRREPSRLGLVVHAATGIALTFSRPGLGLHASLATGVQQSTRGGGHRVQLVVPVSAAHRDVRVPVLVEGASAFGARGWTFGGRAAAGVVLGSTRPSLALQAGLVVGRLVP